MPLFLIAILLFCEMTDLMDGFLARKKKIVSDLGKVLDPMADSITRISVLFTFTQGVVDLPLLLVFVFLYREFFISTLRTICALKGFALAARKSGKLKAVFQAVVNFAVVFMIFLFAVGKISLFSLQAISLSLVSVVALYTVISAADYIYVNREYIRKAFLNSQ